MDTEARIHLDVTGEQAANRKLEKFGDQAKKAGDAVAGAGKSAKGAGSEAEKAGDDFREAADDMGHLSRQALIAAANVKTLVAAFNESGDEGLKKDIRKAKRSRNEALSLLKEIAPDPAQAAEVGAGIGTQLMSGIASAASAAGPAKLIAGGLAVSLVPLIGATVAAAVLGGVGAGGIAGGIALAAQDQRVQSAAQDLAASVTQAFSSNGATFVSPIVEGLDKLSTTGVSAAAKLQPGMDALAGTIEPLVDGIDGFVDGLTDGLVPAAKSAAPVVRFLANELPGLGQAFGDFLTTVSEDPDGAILALGTLLDVTEKVITNTGELIADLSGFYEGIVRTAEPVAGVLSDLYGWLPGAGDSITEGHQRLQGLLADLDKSKVVTGELATGTEKVTYVTQGLGVAAEGAADAINAQRQAMSDLVDLELAAVSGTIAYERAVDNLAESRKENGKTLDLETEKGRSNTEAILAGIEAVKENAEREYDLAIAHGATAQEAEEAARKYRDTFGKELREQIIRLFGNTKAVQDLLAELEKLNGKRITYTVVQKGGRTIGHQMDGGISLAGDEGTYRRASGGPFRSGPMYWVGENGPELVEFKGSGTVHSAAASRAMSGTAAGAAGGQAINVTVHAGYVVTPQQLEDQIARVIDDLQRKGRMG
jgi:hypothetical protein